jgi:butyryl-CoA dehydrogenase
MLNLIESCFPDRLGEWEPKLRELIQTYGDFLNDDPAKAAANTQATAQALGISEAAIEEAIAYAKERQTFGQPIANYQAIQWMLADMATELEAARMLTWKAAAAKPRQERITLEASMAKLAASEAAHKAADKAMQILASAGYRRGSVVERLFRDVRATEIYQGTSEAQRMIIAARILANA